MTNANLKATIEMCDLLTRGHILEPCNDNDRSEAYDAMFLNTPAYAYIRFDEPIDGNAHFIFDYNNGRRIVGQGPTRSKAFADWSRCES